MIASCIIALKGHSRKDLYPSEEISAIQGGGMSYDAQRGREACISLPKGLHFIKSHCIYQAKCL